MSEAMSAAMSAGLVLRALPMVASV
jgi:hypothetical protein